MSDAQLDPKIEAQIDAFIQEANSIKFDESIPESELDDRFVRAHTLFLNWFKDLGFRRSSGHCTVRFLHKKRGVSVVADLPRNLRYRYNAGAYTLKIRTVRGGYRTADTFIWGTGYGGAYCRSNNIDDMRRFLINTATVSGDSIAKTLDLGSPIEIVDDIEVSKNALVRSAHQLVTVYKISVVASDGSCCSDRELHNPDKGDLFWLASCRTISGASLLLLIDHDLNVHPCDNVQRKGATVAVSPRPSDHITLSKGDLALLRSAITVFGERMGEK